MKSSKNLSSRSRYSGNYVSFLSFVPAFLLIAFLSQSCAYSIIISNQRGTPLPDPTNHDVGFYMGKKVITLDTVINLKLIESGAVAVPFCEQPGFHSVEYRISCWDLMRNALTFGKKKAIHAKYVCLKNSNQ